MNRWCFSYLAHWEVCKSSSHHRSRPQLPESSSQLGMTIQCCVSSQISYCCSKIYPAYYHYPSFCCSRSHELVNQMQVPHLLGELVQGL